MSTARRHFHSVISCTTALALLAAQAQAVRAASPITQADYEACQAGDEQGFRTAIESITRKGLQAGLAGVDYKALVADEWRKGNVDDVIDKQVDLSIGEVRDESSWFDLMRSLASKDKAQELATTAAERVYRSEPIKKAIELLATGLGREIGKRIELATTDTAGPAARCMQAFLGKRYGSTIARVVSADASNEYAIDPAKASVQVSSGQLIIEGGGTIAGAMVLAVRRQLTSLTARIGQRLVGSVLSRLVGVVAGGIGLVLIAKDIWDFRHGVLPIISEEMKSKANKDKVRDELAKSISEHIAESVNDISDKTAQRVVEIWQEFRRAHAQVLDLAERLGPFKHFLETVKPSDMPRVDEMVGLVLGKEGEEGITRRLADGTLQKAVTSLPAPALEIAREQRSLEAALRWSAVAGEGALAKVVEYEIHRRTTPDTFTRPSLERLLGLQDRLAITRLAALPPAARVPLFELDANDLKQLARALDEPQLESLSRYLTGLEPAPAQRILRAVAQTPSRMAELGSPTVRNAILASRDQSAAVGMMLQASWMPDPVTVLAHAELVLHGRVSPLLLWAKYPVVVVGAGVLALIVLMILKRLLFGTRPKVIVQHASAPTRGRGRRA